MDRLYPQPIDVNQRQGFSAARAGNDTRVAVVDEASHASSTAEEHVERPLAAYAALMGIYALAFVGPLAVAAKRGALPRRPPLRDLVLLGVGTFKLSRLLTTDAVTGFMRAPFVRYEGMEGVSSPKESPRGTGLRRAVGQLLLCPVCAGFWVASAMTAGLVVAPRATRLASGALAVAAVSDFLQSAHKVAADEAADEAADDADE
jgi:hypothetical protein